MNEHCVKQRMNSNELNNYSEEVQNGDHEYDSVNQEKEINTEKFEPSDQVKTNK